MKKWISKFIYLFIAFLLIIYGIIVKYFLVDTDLGAREKNFNKVLLSSDIIFIFAIILLIIGLIFYLIKKNRNATLGDSTIIFSSILIMPITLMLVITPFLQTYFPDKSHDKILSSLFGGISIIGVFAFFAWIILLMITFIRQTFIILTSKKEK
jgi:hypothetical protein